MKLPASLGRIVGLVLVSAVSLQLYFGARVALMAVVDPQSTTFQRSEIWRIAVDKGRLAWSQVWVDYAHIAPSLKRAVIASEDAGFAEHSGVEWDALEKAWERNQKAEATADRLDERASRRNDRAPAARSGAMALPAPPSRRPVKVVGGSTITQQLAKNLFLGGERNLARKAQEFVITGFLEALLTKRRILELYLNSVEWGEGIFGAEAAALHYFHVHAQALTAAQAASLAVMLPAPKRFERRPASSYLLGRSATVLARMTSVDAP